MVPWVHCSCKDLRNQKKYISKCFYYLNCILLLEINLESYHKFVVLPWSSSPQIILYESLTTSHVLKWEMEGQYMISKLLD